MTVNIGQIDIVLGILTLLEKRKIAVNERQAEMRCMQWERERAIPSEETDAMTTDTTGAALLAIVRANPADWDARRVYADWLDDGSDEGAIAANGQRWQAWKQRYPERHGYTRYGIYIIGVRWCGKRKPSYVQSKLPKLILEEMGLTGRESVVGEIKFASPDAAEAALARALWELGIQGVAAT